MAETESPSNDLMTVPRGWAVKRRAGLFLPLGFGAFALLMIPSILSSELDRGPLITTFLVFALLSFCGWALTRAAAPSAKGPQLINAVVLTDASTPPPDSWVHFARLTPIPWATVGTFGILGVLLGGGAAALAATAVVRAKAGLIELEPPKAIGMIAILTIMGAIGVFFLYVAAKSIVSNAKASGWPRRHGITLGETGIAYRLADASIDIPWDEITAVEALLLPSRERGVPAQTLLRITSTSGVRDFRTQDLGVSPLMLVTALDSYWRHPEQRAELGTTFGQARLERWAKAL